MTLKVLVYAWIASLAAMAAPAQAQTPAYQGELSAKIDGPRKVATTAEGELFVSDVEGRLHRLTRRGDYVAKLLDGVTAVATSPGVLLVATKDGALLQINPRTGRVLRKISLETSEAPAALAFDAARGKLWIAFESGALVARGLDGKKLHEIAPRPGVHRLNGVAVDGAGKVWTMQDRTGAAGTMHSYDAATGEFVASVAVPVAISGGMAIGANGRFYVSDYVQGKVQMLEAQGVAAGSVGANGYAPGELSQPSGVSFLANGDLVVANMDAGRLDRFGSGAALPECAGDADCDGLSDEWEKANGFDANDASNALGDADVDGLNETEELVYGANPRSGDTDGDGYKDGEEVASGFDPRDGDDHRPQVLASGGGATDPGLVRLSATVHDPVSGRGACSASWKQLSGAPVTLRGATTPSPSFIARQAGPYVFEAVASCGGVTSVAKRVEVAVNNVAPRADGGRVVTLGAGSRLQLSGQQSADANGDSLAFQWQQVAGAPVVDALASKVLTTRVQAPGYYAFRLGATDPAGAQGFAEVAAVVLGDVPVPTAAAASPVLAVAGQAVTLDASTSYRGVAATFAWRQVEGVEVALSDVGAETATFVPPAAGRYLFEVTVAEGGVQSPPARVEVYAAPAGGTLPVARASAPATAFVDAAIVLDGAASSGASGEALVYAWRQVSGPAAGLTRADRAAATAVLFEAGSYEFELTVSDQAAVSVPARVRIDARSKAKALPVAVAVAKPAASVGELVLLDGRASTGALRYRWTQVAGPWVLVDQGATASFVPPAPGAYGFELEVDDGSVRSAPVRVNVVVTANGTEN